MARCSPRILIGMCGFGGNRMYLKEIVMKNFKSFGHEKRVPFLPGVTAITGPNGSGKSNIGDAILFVLGPKSPKAIRAGKLPHLIFNGGKSGKPATHCRVSLIFDNTDRLLPVNEDDVELTRVIKLSPSDATNYYSHFYINGRPCKLNDFEQLLSHARISSNGYNLVQQGDINQITSMGSIDRRRILDSIAGISMFDRDIDRANADRDQVMHNLENVDILLKDLENTLARVKRERDNALAYQEIKREHGENEARLLKRRILNQESLIRDTEEKIARYTGELETLRKRIRENTDGKFLKERELKGIEDRILEMGGEEAEELRTEIDGLTVAIARTEEGIKYSTEERQRLRSVIHSANQETGRIKREISTIEEERARDAEALGVESRALTGLRDEIEKVRERITSTSTRTMDINREIILLKRAHEEQGAVFREKKLELDRLTERRRIRSREIDELTESAEGLEFEVKDIDWRIGELRTKTAHSSKRKGELEREFHRFVTEEKRLVAEINTLEHRIRTAQMEYSRRKAEAEAHEHMTQGYGRSVNLIIEARENRELRGIIGTVSELLTVEEQYRTAVSIAAGGKLQAVIVEDDATAAAAIQLLKRRQGGRVTFLPLNRMVPARARGRALMLEKQSGFMGRAIELVNFDERYRNAMSYVFQDTLVARDLDVARANMGGVRIVTLAGDLIDPSGAMTGGTIKQPQFTFGGSRGEVDRLGEELRAMEERHGTLSERLSILREEMTAAGKELDHYRDDTAGEVARLETERNRLHSRYRAQLSDLETARGELGEMDRTIERETGGVESIHQEIAARQEKITGLGELLLRTTDRNLAEAINSLERDKSARESVLQDLRARVEVFDQRLALHRERIGALTGEIARSEQGIATCSGNEAGYRRELDDLRQRKEARIKVQLQMSRELEGVRKQRDGVFGEIKELEKLIEQDNTRFSTFGQMLDDLEIKLPDQRAEHAAVVEEFAALGCPVEEEGLPPEEELRKLVKVLGEKMRRLEPVNMLAVKEYESLSERQREKRDLRTRLIEQKDGLEKVVAQLTEKKTRALDDIFSAVNTNFKEIYASLSNGGSAELMLENPENPFEGGLQISARPRGKKVLYLNALSGGEKSLTAIAFIFAIQRYMPSPFYYLDEIDMFLDASNAGNVAAMLKNNARYAQIIIVSLRKVTLMAADNLYGVTMFGKGLSEIVAFMSKESLKYIAGDDLQDDDAVDARPVSAPGASGGSLESTMNRSDPPERILEEGS